MYLALVDQAFLGLVYEFDGIFDGEDVVVAIVVDEIDHRGQRRTLARASGTRDEDQAARDHTDVPEGLAHVQVFHSQDFGRNGSKYRARTAVLIEGVDPEARDARHLEREVGLEEFLEVLALLVVHDLVDQRVYFRVLERRQVDASDVSVDSYHRRQPGREMQVGSALFCAEREEFRNVH